MASYKLDFYDNDHFSGMFETEEATKILIEAKEGSFTIVPADFEVGEELYFIKESNSSEEVQVYIPNEEPRKIPIKDFIEFVSNYFEVFL